MTPPGPPWGSAPATFPSCLQPLHWGGHVRVGMEDNVVYAKNRLAKSNAEFVERAARLIREANKEVASPSDARAILNLKR